MNLFRGKEKVTILSIDGGGIRGYIPALILEELSRLLVRKGKSLHFTDHFDLIAGTSSGSLTALGLTAPAPGDYVTGGLLDKPRFSISEIVNMYEVRRNEIFPQIPLGGIQTLKQAFHEKYDDRGFRRVLNDLFEDLTISDSLSNILISSYDLKGEKPVMIRKSMVKNTGEDFYIRDVARGSSAAPTFFEPYTMTSLSGETEYFLVDGALAANNPSLYAYIEARELYPKADKFLILSLGTGYTKHTWNYKKVKKWGFLDWISPQNDTPLYKIMEESQGQCVDSVLSSIPGIEYYRINTEIPPERDEIDDSSIENMKFLKSIALGSIKTHSKTLEKIAGEL